MTENETKKQQLNQQYNQVCALIGDKVGTIDTIQIEIEEFKIKLRNLKVDFQKVENAILKDKLHSVPAGPIEEDKDVQA